MATTRGRCGACGELLRWNDHGNRAYWAHPSTGNWMRPDPEPHDCNTHIKTWEEPDPGEHVVEVRDQTRQAGDVVSRSRPMKLLTAVKVVDGFELDEERQVVRAVPAFVDIGISDSALVAASLDDFVGRLDLDPEIWWALTCGHHRRYGRGGRHEMKAPRSAAEKLVLYLEGCPGAWAGSEYGGDPSGPRALRAAIQGIRAALEAE